MARKLRNHGPFVCIMWCTGPDTVSGLTFGDGTLRAYEKDRYDPRAGDALPFVPDGKGFLAWLGNENERGRPAQVPVWIAKHLGFEVAHH